MKVNVWETLLTIVSGVASIIFLWKFGTTDGKTASNEQIKLTANALNTVAIGIFLSALIVPSLQKMDPTEPLTRQHFILLMAYAPHLMFAIVLHVAARFMLSTLKD